MDLWWGGSNIQHRNNHLVHSHTSIENEGIEGVLCDWSIRSLWIQLDEPGEIYSEHNNVAIFFHDYLGVLIILFGVGKLHYYLECGHHAPFGSFVL